MAKPRKADRGARVTPKTRVVTTEATVELRKAKVRELIGKRPSITSRQVFAEFEKLKAAGDELYDVSLRTIEAYFTEVWKAVVAHQLGPSTETLKARALLELDEIKELAVADEQYAPAVSALKEKNAVLGLHAATTVRVEDITPSHMKADDERKQILKLMKELGIGEDDGKRKVGARRNGAAH